MKIPVVSHAYRQDHSRIGIEEAELLEHEKARDEKHDARDRERRDHKTEDKSTATKLESGQGVTREAVEKHPTEGDEEGDERAC